MKKTRQNNVFKNLGKYEPSKSIKYLYRNNFLSDGRVGIETLKLINEIERTKLNAANYHNAYSTAIHIEDMHQQTEEPGCVFHNCKLTIVNEDMRATKIIYKFEFRNDESIKIVSADGSRLLLFGTENRKNILFGKCNFSNSKFITFMMEKSISLDQSYKILFESPCRLTFRLEHWALSKIREYKLVDFLLNPTQNAFTADDKNNVDQKSTKLNDSNFIEKRILQNPEQREAVESIVGSKSLSAPFLLIGYPGTGKTQVIVECIHQLLLNGTNAKILVCAGINFVLDEITLRLQKSLCSRDDSGSKKLLRYYASSQEEKVENIDLIGISNFDVNKKSDTNIRNAILNADVILCTFAMAGRIAFSYPQFKSFTHLFIDEAQSATEPITLIPIVGLCSRLSQINAQIIFAGDTKQLGPLVKTNEANKLGYGSSMMERLLLNCDIYQPDAETKLYNSSVICKLVRNYRSHPDILKMPNELFYNNEMISCGNSRDLESGVVNSLRQFNIIPSKFPIVFHWVFGLTQKEKSSLYNEKEINYVYHLLKKLLETGKYNQKEIGIIAPYKQQAIKIESLLYENELNDVKVGTVKQFIGQERLVIIVSTVRSESRNLGFLVDKKRINVLLTRAISLMIFVGNGNTLLQNSLWKRIINNCIENRSGYLTNRG